MAAAPPPYALGVDLGTTFTAAAVCRGDAIEIVPLTDHHSAMPSVVLRSADGALVFGEAAVRRAVHEPEGVAREFKREFGSNTEMMLAGHGMLPSELTAALLGDVIAHVARGEGGPPSALALSYPAGWGEHRRAELERVLAATGIPGVLCTEPESAAVYAAQAGRLPEGATIAVFDVGGGTVDCAVVRRRGESFEVVGAPQGTPYGGADISDQVLDYVMGFVDLTGVDVDDEATKGALLRIRRDCVEAKEALSSDTAVTVSAALGGRDQQVRLTRGELDGFITPAIDDAVGVLKRTIAAAGLAQADLDAVLLVGGSARIPLVAQLVAAQLGRPPTLSAQPKLCVAMGAAWLGSRRLVASTTAVPVVELAAPEPVIEEVVAPPASPLTPVTAPAAVVSVPRTAARRPPYGWVALAAAAVAALLAALGPDVDTGGSTLTWSATHIVADPSLRTGDRLRPTPLGITVFPDSEPLKSGQVDLSGYSLLLAGPMRGEVLSGTQQPRQVVLAPAKVIPPWQKMITIPFAALVIAALFSLAYAESLLRGIRQRRADRPTVSEAAGLVATGLVAAAALVLGVWIFRSVQLPGLLVAVIVILGGVSLGFLGFAQRRRVSRSAP